MTVTHVSVFHVSSLTCLDCSIWKYLVQQSVDHGRTVIITTHYIEEARQADAVRAVKTKKNYYPLRIILPVTKELRVHKSVVIGKLLKFRLSNRWE